MSNESNAVTTGESRRPVVLKSHSATIVASPFENCHSFTIDKRTHLQVYIAAARWNRERSDGPVAVSQSQGMAMRWILLPPLRGKRVHTKLRHSSLQHELVHTGRELGDATQSVEAFDIRNRVR